MPRLSKPLHCLGLDRGPHLGQRTWCRVNKAGHMIAIDPPVRFLTFPLASKGPSTHGTEGLACGSVAIDKETELVCEQRDGDDTNVTRQKEASRW